MMPVQVIEIYITMPLYTYNKTEICKHLEHFHYLFVL